MDMSCVGMALNFGEPVGYVSCNREKQIVGSRVMIVLFVIYYSIEGDAKSNRPATRLRKRPVGYDCRLQRPSALFLPN
jgi:hypothetical protein